MIDKSNGKYLPVICLEYITSCSSCRFCLVNLKSLSSIATIVTACCRVCSCWKKFISLCWYIWNSVMLGISADVTLKIDYDVIFQFSLDQGFWLNSSYWISADLVFVSIHFGRKGVTGKGNRVRKRGEKIICTQDSFFRVRQIQYEMHSKTE